MVKPVMGNPEVLKILYKELVLLPCPGSRNITAENRVLVRH
jgi:hypothetical protein